MTTSFFDHFAAGYLARAARDLGARHPTAVLAGRNVPAAATDGLVLAGWWCRADAPEPLVVLPNPWDDRDAVVALDALCARLELRLLAGVSQALDGAHGVTRPQTWWPTILSHWLALTVAEVLDRVLFVRTARALAPGAPLLGEQDTPLPADTILEASWLQASDAWSVALVCELWRMDGGTVQTAAHADTHATAPMLDDTPATRLRQLMRIGVRGAGRMAARMALGRERGRQVVLLGGHGLSVRDTRALGAGVRQLPRPALRPATTTHALGVRERLVLPAGETAEERTLLTLLPRLLPCSVVEGHAALVAANERLYGRPAAAVDASYGFDDANLVYLARCRAAGYAIGLAQHGGSTSQLRAAPGDRIEDGLGVLRLAWGRPQGDNVRTVGTPRLERLRDTYTGGDHVVLIESASPPMSQLLRFTTTPLANQVYGERDLVVAFVALLDGPARERLVLKRFPRYTADEDRPAALQALPQPLAGTATEAMRTARLAVLTYPDTPFIEALVLGVPTVGLWRTDLWEMRDDARGPFAALQAAGVIHADPAAAAAHVAAIHADPGSWWQTPQVREARRAFLERFAPATDWRARWSAALEELAA